ncbi:MAG: acyl carrier protein [Lachnospiraceae bacterium]|jgi:acyl carrier protein|nr:acyl carrier protein [Lachnospiraceae bacterium]
MTFEKVKEIIVDMIHCDETQVTMEAGFEALGIDSLDATELCMTIEEAFEITIEEDAMMEFHTVSDIVTYIEKKTAA